VTDSDIVKQVVVVAAEDRAKITEWASAEGVTVFEIAHRAFDPVTAVTLLLTGSTVAVGVVTHLLDRAKGGQVIDLRADAPRMLYRTTDLVYGLVTIITREGVVSVEVKEPKGMLGSVLESLRGVLTDIAGLHLNAAADAVKVAVGDRAHVRKIESADGREIPAS